MRIMAILGATLWLLGGAACVNAQETLHARIDALVLAGAKGHPVSAPADDAEFLRRTYLDFAGRIPTIAETRRFLDDKDAKKRVQLLDQLLASPEYATRMEDLFHLVLMERLGDHVEWKGYLQRSFGENKPWDQMVREMLQPTSQEKAHSGASFFLSRRLENVGANPVDYPALTRDIGRLFLGKDFRCAQCHDHLTVKEYKQLDFQGLFGFVKNVGLAPGKPAAPGVAEKPTTQKIEFSSVFTGEQQATGPRIPGSIEIPIPVMKKGQEYLVPPDPKAQKPGVLKFSTLEALARDLPTPANQAFNRNIVNRLWFLMMGRGLIHPLDLAHDGNPPSHPELLDLLAKEFVAHKYAIKWMLRELALTQTYQRSSRLPKNAAVPKPEEFRTALERRLSADQLLRSMMEATGTNDVKSPKKAPPLESLRPTFNSAFAFPPREPEEEFNPTLKATLFLLNDKTVLSWLEPTPGNLLDRLEKLTDDRKIADELYLSVLSRLPDDDETKATVRYLDERRDRRPAALRNLVWSLLASTEFCVNH